MEAGPLELTPEREAYEFAQMSARARECGLSGTVRVCSCSSAAACVLYAPMAGNRVAMFVGLRLLVWVGRQVRVQAPAPYLLQGRALRHPHSSMRLLAVLCCRPVGGAQPTRGWLPGLHP